MTAKELQKEINVLKGCLPDSQKFSKESYAREYLKEKIKSLRNIFTMKLKSSDCFPNPKVIYREVWEYYGYELLCEINTKFEVYFSFREE
ncbi:MAG: hypothetical protein WC755_09295 [Candidatus Woesearchaeota archaeon]|jgi:hypothetical protein